MKYVQKEDSPVVFEEWKKMANENWAPTYANISREAKTALHDSLLIEQGYVCCYCGKSIEKEDSHIEHFIPQNSRPDLALDYFNLYASCIKEVKPTNPIHCGHAKAGEYDQQNFIAPVDIGCERRYAYTLDGKINPLNDTDSPAKYMQKLLDLSHVSLNIRREKILKSVFDDDFLSQVSAQELITLSVRFREATEGRLSDLGHAVARFAERLAESIQPASQ